MSDSQNDLSAEEEFALLINLVMAKAIENGADPDAMAHICQNTVRELYNHYGAGEDHSSYQSFLKDSQFKMAEIEEWQKNVEGEPWKDDE